MNKVYGLFYFEYVDGCKRFGNLVPDNLPYWWPTKQNV